MSKLTYFKAKTFLKRGKVKLISQEGLYLHFEVNDHEVFRTFKGWSCNAVDKKDKGKGCILFNREGHKCSHILASEMWLKGADLNDV